MNKDAILATMMFCGSGSGGSLPDVTAADAGDTMRVNESGEWDKTKSVYNLPAFFSTLQTQVTGAISSHMSSIIAADGKTCLVADILLYRKDISNPSELAKFDEFCEAARQIYENKDIIATYGGQTVITNKQKSGTELHLAYDNYLVISTYNLSIHFVIKTPESREIDASTAINIDAYIRQNIIV